MTLKISTKDQIVKITTITLNGRLDAFEAPALRKLCDTYIESEYSHFVFDLTDVAMLDSAGLAVLVSVLKRARLKDGDVRLVWPREEAASRILKLTKFDQVFVSIERAEIIPKGF
ncbi:MAG TPA: STAS domain-containing protein [Anaerolineales bacterium]|nr:STAS domain-containing protein [Anaerolineales bacterium]HNA89202.1 STAS domain-containing protein [Anaerolineales bacterium]HNB35655.1 STAS domain-containing protein [Anaerolineales bacterium]HNC07596.1 STAS domain-containing protein [Anaerolineales bacterium]